MIVLFWDFDGTLVYSNSLWSKSVYSALKEVEKNTTVEFSELRKHMAYGYTWDTPEEDYRTVIHDAWWDFMNRHFYHSYIKCGVKPHIASEAVTRIRNIIKKRENYVLYKDTAEVLEQSKNLGYINVLLSNNYPDLEEVLISLDLRKYFDDVVISSCEGYDKPRKELFEIAKSKYPDASYYMIGDNLKADIAGGKQSNMTTILVHRGYSREADYCFDNLTPILDILPH